MAELNRPQQRAELRERFTTVYNEGLWGSEESRSGQGSAKGSPSVQIAVEALAKAVAEHNITSINDIPCGDFNWIPDVLATIPGVAYTGFDIVTAAITRNKDEYPQYDFRVFDITTETPPQCDLIFCKDLLNHLTDDDVRRAVANMRRSGSKFLLASNNPGFEYTPLADFANASRHLDITAPPFNYPAPLWTVSGYMSFWRLADMDERSR